MLLSSAQTTSPLPSWLQITSVALSVIGAVTGLYLFGLRIYETYRSAILDVVLTKDSFVRLNNLGECVFCIATVLARRGPVLITNVQVDLEKTDGARKRYGLTVKHAGEVVLGTNVFADLKYIGASVLAYIPEVDPRRVVYLCNLKDYVEEQTSLVADFNSAVLALKSELVQISIENDEPRDAQDFNRDIVSKIYALCDTYIDRMIGAVQIEPGAYRLSIKMTYESLGSAAKSSKTLVADSLPLEVVVPPRIREILRGNLLEALRVSAQNVIFEKTVEIKWPQVEFLQAQETRSRVA